MPRQLATRSDPVCAISSERLIPATWPERMTARSKPNHARANGGSCDAPSFCRKLRSDDMKNKTLFSFVSGTLMLAGQAFAQAVHVRSDRCLLPGRRRRRLPVPPASLPARSRHKPAREASTRAATSSASISPAAGNTDSCSKTGNTPVSIFLLPACAQRSPTASTLAARSSGNSRCLSTIQQPASGGLAPLLPKSLPILPASKASITGAANSQP